MSENMNAQCTSSMNMDSHVPTERTSMPGPSRPGIFASLHGLMTHVHDKVITDIQEGLVNESSTLEQLNESKVMLEQCMQELHDLFTQKTILDAKMIAMHAQDGHHEQIKLDIEQLQAEICEACTSLNNIKMCMHDHEQDMKQREPRAQKCHYDAVSDTEDVPQDTSDMSSPKVHHVQVKTTDASKHVVPCNLPKFGLIKGKSSEPETFLCNFVLGLSTHGLDIEEHWLRLLPGCLPNHDVAWFDANMSPSFNWAQAKQLVLEHVREVAECLTKAGLVINVKKCNFF